MTQPVLQDEEALREFFRELELRRTRALVERDMETVDELHAPEYELIAPAGKVFDRERYLSAIEREPFYAGWEAGEMAFRISPAMSIIRYKARLTFPSGRELMCWHTDAYENRAGLWKVVWSQATEVKQAQPQP